MAIVQQGSTNPGGLIVPGFTYSISAPKVPAINGVPTNKMTIVGTAPWGPVNQPVAVSDIASYERVFGKIQNRKHDAGTLLAIAAEQGANHFDVIRVTDGTDTKATKVHQVSATAAITLTAINSGSFGNNIQFSFLTGSKASTIKTVIGIPGIVTEVYDNLPTTDFWPALVSAINAGNTLYAVKPSELVTATVGTSTTAPTLNAGAVNLAGGTDGVTTITAAVLVGTDGVTPTGMFAARKRGSSILVLTDADDSTSWTAQVAFGLAEGMTIVGTAPSAASASTVIASKQTAGIDSPSFWLFDGNWKLWNDRFNGVTRVVSNQGFAAGRLAALSPEQSPLNKPLFGIVGAQKTAYTDAELALLFSAGVDVITNPAPGGDYWAVRGDYNTSSNAATNGLNYPRMTNFIAATLDKAMGREVGRVINTDTFQSVTAALKHFLSGLESQGVLARQEDGSMPFSVRCDASNNPQSRTSLGYLQAEVRVRYQSITRFFNVISEGGQTVTITVREEQ